jgi:hypothetical protein
MTLVTPEEIAQFRSEVSAYSQAQQGLDVIEDCEGDLEDAALVLAIEVGQQPDSLTWLDGFAKRCRPTICRSEFREDLLNGKVLPLVEYLVVQGICPEKLVGPVLLYVMKQGINEFCDPLS